MILEGAIVLESEGIPRKRYGVGEAIFFREGAHAKWHVEDYVKKIAFCRQTNALTRFRHPRRQHSSIDQST